MDKKGGLANVISFFVFFGGQRESGWEAEQKGEKKEEVVKKKKEEKRKSIDYRGHEKTGYAISDSQ